MTRFQILIAAVLAFAAIASPTRAQSETAIFAGGCFWCVEADFDKVPGVTSTTSGYIGGKLANPTYKQVSAGGTGHYEAVQITYNPSRVSYEQLVDIFFRTVDPTDAGGQFCDRGNSYRTAIFALNGEQKKSAASAKSRAAKDLGKRIVTPVKGSATFYPAEGYHQNYYKKSPLKYKYYRFSCGRDARVKELWGGQAYAGVGGNS